MPTPSNVGDAAPPEASPAFAAAVAEAAARLTAEAADAGRLLRETEACERLAVSRATLWRLVQRGELRPVRIGRAVRFAVGALDAIARRGAPLAR